MSNQILIDKAALCESWRDIEISKNDVLTEETADEIEDNNNVRQSGWGCPPTHRHKRNS